MLSCYNYNAMKIIDITDEYVFENIKERPDDCHKGDFGRLMNIAGSACYIGSAMLSSASALRSGCGYVYLASTTEVARGVIPFVPEAVSIRLPADVNGCIALTDAAAAALSDKLARMQAVAFGCGIGSGDEMLRFLIQSCRAPLVIDADGLNALAVNESVLKDKKCPIILTPHLGEFSRLSGLTAAAIKEGRAEAVCRYAGEHDATVLLKGAETLICSPNGDMFRVTSGTAGMAKAGSGDALTGIIGSLAAQGLSPLSAACCGAWLHGAAGSEAAHKRSKAAMTAADLIDCLGDVFLKYGR